MDNVDVYLQLQNDRQLSGMAHHEEQGQEFVAEVQRSGKRLQEG